MEAKYRPVVKEVYRSRDGVTSNEMKKNALPSHVMMSNGTETRSVPAQHVKSAEAEGYKRVQ